MPGDILTLFLAGHDLEREGRDSLSGPCPFCGDGGKPHTGPGRSDRFVVWPGDAGRGNVPGRYRCRQCGAQGDALAFLMQAHGMAYPDAARAVGHGTGPGGVRPIGKAAPISCRANTGFTPKPDGAAPGEVWQRTARALVDEARRYIGTDAARAELERRFLTVEQARRFGLGWMPRDRWLVPSKDLGLDAETKPDGTEKKTCFPCGLVIPVERDGVLVAVEVRRKRGTEYNGAKYAFLKGGGGHFMAGEPGLPVVVAESKLDCMRLHDVTGLGVLALPASHRPTAAEFELLQAASLVLVDFDNDPAGQKAREWWLDGKLPRAKAAGPTGSVKNFGDLPDADLWVWLEHETLGQVDKPGAAPHEPPTGAAVDAAPIPCRAEKPKGGAWAWPGPHTASGNPYCEWLPGINRTLPEDIEDLQGYGFPSTGLPPMVQSIASCGWRIMPEYDERLGEGMFLKAGPNGAKLRGVCERYLNENYDAIACELTFWEGYHRHLPK